MNEIVQIVKLITKSKIKNIDIIDNTNSASRETQLYRMILSGEIQTDKDLLEHFYKGDPKAEQNVKKFRSDFLEHVLSTLLFIDKNNQALSDYEINTINITKAFTTTNILFRKGLTSIACTLFESLLDEAIHYDMTTTVIQITERIKGHYSGRVGDKIAYAKYKEIHHKYIQIWLWELKAKEYYEDVKIHFAKSAAYQPHLSKELEISYAEIAHAHKEYNTHDLQLYAYLILMNKFNCINDYKGVLEIADKALEVFSKKPYQARAAKSLFLNQKLIAHMQLCQYEEGQNAASASMALQNEGSVNWFKTLEYSTILAFHSAQYDKAFSHYQTATTHPQYKNMEKLDAEIWTLFEAYLYFLHTKKKLKGGEVEKSKLKNFRVHKFINELEILDKDRDGMNIQAKIIEVVIRLTAEDLKMMGEAEALDKYRLRHVVARDEIGYRTNQFLKILVKLANHGDVYSCDQEEIEEIVSDIATTPYSIEKQGYKAEIIPFDILWQVIKERAES